MTRLLLAGLGQRQIGATGVLTGKRPGRFAMSNQIDLSVHLPARQIRNSCRLSCITPSRVLAIVPCAAGVMTWVLGILKSDLVSPIAGTAMMLV